MARITGKNQVGCPLAPSSCVFVTMTRWSEGCIPRKEDASPHRTKFQSGAMEVMLRSFVSQTSRLNCWLSMHAFEPARFS